MVEERLKLAVFIDFDNIQIGVKDTLGKDFDVAVVLEDANGPLRKRHPQSFADGLLILELQHYLDLVSLAAVSVMARHGNPGHVEELDLLGFVVFDRGFAA